MRASTGIRTFRSPPSLVMVVVACAVLFLGGTLVSFRTLGQTWVTFAFVGLSVFGVAAIADVLTQRVSLYEDKLVVVRNLRTREYPRTMFVKATWGKGVPVSLQATSGDWIQLPGVGQSSQGLVNTLRAWIKDGRYCGSPTPEPPN